MNYPKLVRLTKEIDWQKLEQITKENLINDKSGHDYPHSVRVINNAIKISKAYSEVDYDVLIASCWLHDIAFKDGWVTNHHILGAKQCPPFLKTVNFPESKIKNVQIVIEDHVGQVVAPIRKSSELSIESKILRDADNIDALGSIGLARQIAFCAANNIPYFNSINDGWNQSAYGGIKSIITWADKMLTPEGKKMGKARVPIMKAFLKQIEKEYS